MTNPDGPNGLRCLFHATVEATDEGYVVEVPATEVERGTLAVGEVYRVALLEREVAGPARSRASPPKEPQPPVEVGEIRYVEIEDLGKQGDGIARVERGYVIIVPGGSVGERVKVEIAEVKPNFAVGDLVEERFD